MYGHVSCFFCIVANFIEINFAEKFTDNDLDESNVKDTNCRTQLLRALKKLDMPNPM